MSSTVPQMPLDIAIVGGGIAGLVLAVSLLKQNVKLTIYESASQFGEIGAGVGMGPNAVRALTLIDPRLRQAYEKIVSRPVEVNDETIWFNFLCGEDQKEGPKAGDYLATVTCGIVAGGVHRAEFLDQLVQLIPPEIAHFGKRVTSLEDQGDTGVILRFRDGTEAIHQVVVGCDGVRSEVRKHILGADNPASYPEFRQIVCHRGLVPMNKAAEILGEENTKCNTMYLGSRRHVLTTPIQGGKTMNLVAYYPQTTWDSTNWTAPGDKESLQQEFQTWGNKIQKILGFSERTDVWAIFDSLPAETYFKGPIAIVGDAAHASMPHQGSGAAMGIEDCFVLANLLGLAKDRRSVENAFAAYDKVRRERTQKFVVTSRDACKLWSFELEGVGFDSDKLGKNARERMQWIWNEDLSQEVEEAKRIMQELST